MQEELRAIITKHCTTLRAEARAISDSIQDMARPGADAAACLKQAIAHAHTVKGSSGTIGFGEVSLRAQMLETILRMMGRASPPPTAAEIGAAGFLCEELNSAIAKLHPTDSSLYNAELVQGGRP